MNNKCKQMTFQYTETPSSFDEYFHHVDADRTSKYWHGLSKAYIREMKEEIREQHEVCQWDNPDHSVCFPTQLSLDLFHDIMQRFEENDYSYSEEDLENNFDSKEGFVVYKTNSSNNNTNNVCRKFLNVNV